jgi:hypothetical protein
MSQLVRGRHRTEESERHGELQVVVANLQCKNRHLSGAIALQIVFLSFTRSNLFSPGKPGSAGGNFFFFSKKIEGLGW